MNLKHTNGFLCRGMAGPLAWMVFAGSVIAGTHPDFLPRPPLEYEVFASGTPFAHNERFFEITDSLGGDVHKAKRNDLLLVRYIRPPDGHPDRHVTPGSTSFTRAPDMSGTGFDPGTGHNGVLQVDIVEPFNNLLFSSDFNLSPPDRIGLPSSTANCNCLGVDWDVWGDGGPYSLYQFTLRVENIPEHLANRWLIMHYGTNQEWPISFQRPVPLNISSVTNSADVLQAGETLTATVTIINNSSTQTYCGVCLREAVRSDTLRRITDPDDDGCIGDEIPKLGPGESVDVTLEYEAIEDGPAFVSFQLEATDDIARPIYSSGVVSRAFTGGRADLISYNLQSTTTMRVFYDDIYRPDDPVTSHTTATVNRGAEYEITVENDGPTERAFVLRLAETNAAGWNHTFLLDGVDIGPAMRSAGGYPLGTLALGETRELAVNLLPGDGLTAGARSDALLEVAMDVGNREAVDAIRFTTEFVPGSLKTELEVVPVAGNPDRFRVRVAVTNCAEAVAEGVIARVVTPPGASSTEGTLPFRFVSGESFDPVFVDLDPGATHVFEGTMELLLDDGPYEVLVDAGGRVPNGNGANLRNIRSNFASALTDGSVTEPRTLGLVDSNFDFDSQRLTLTWESVVGREYVIEASTNLQPGTWTTVGTSITAASATTTNQVSFGDLLSRQFFRVRER